MEQDYKRNLWAKIALFTAALIWGSSFFIVKDVTEELPPNFLLAVRFTVGCLVLAAIFNKKLKLISKEYLIKGAVIGLCLFAAYSTQTIGIKDTTPGKNAFLTAVYCVIVPFLFWAVNRIRPDKYNLIAAVLCLGGIGFVSLNGDFTIGIGDSLTLLGGFFFALHMVMVAKLVKDKDPVLISILQFGFTAIAAWIVTLCWEPRPTGISTESIGGVLYLSIGCTAIALLLQNIGQKYTNPSGASIILSLEAVFGVFFSVLLYGEVLTIKLICGFVFIFLAILVSETKCSFISKGFKKRS